MPANTVRPNGPRIKDLRTRKGWTQEALAEAADVKLRTVQRIETGGQSLQGGRKIARVYLSTIDALARPGSRSGGLDPSG